MAAASRSCRGDPTASRVQPGRVIDREPHGPGEGGGVLGEAGGRVVMRDPGEAEPGEPDWVEAYDGQVFLDGLQQGGGQVAAGYDARDVQAEGSGQVGYDLGVQEAKFGAVVGALEGWVSGEAHEVVGVGGYDVAKGGVGGTIQEVGEGFGEGQVGEVQT